MYATRILRHQPLRLALTLGGIALCIVLMLFLLSIYRGVADGSVDYIRRSTADLWVLQRNATNILRGSSILSTAHGLVIREIHGIEAASPVLFLLSSVQKDDERATIFLTGFDPATGLGGPPNIITGRSVVEEGDIVLDKSFAAKHHLALGDLVRIQDDVFHVVGISNGTNAFVIQYAFVSIRRAQALINVPNLVTCFLLRAEHGANLESLAAAIRADVPGVEVYDRATFLQNNIDEMESGFLPLLYTIASIGAIVLTAILSLLLSINILERRKDFAIMKTLGAPIGFLPALIIKLALLISSASGVLALALFFPMVSFIEWTTPEITTRSSPAQVVIVFLVVATMSLISSLIAMLRLRHIYSLETFS
jgi:putative ABC transport system permease protein